MKTKATIATVLALGLVLTMVGSALGMEPAYGSGITVDGIASDWNLTSDFFSDMREAGDFDTPKTLLSKLYLRYDCGNQIMYVLVLAEAGQTPLQNDSDSWLKIDANNNKVFDGTDSPADGIQPDFEYVFDNAELRGYEASFSIPPGNYTYEAHIQIDDGNGGATSSTGKFAQNNEKPLDIVCEMPQTGTIIIEKQTDPIGGTGFGFANNIPGGPATFSLNDGSSQTFNNIATGSYTVSEDDPYNDGFYLTDLVCDDSDVSGTASTVDLGSRTATINLDPGETVTCTYTNSEYGRIRVIKDTVPDAAQDFTFTMTGTVHSPFTLDDDDDPTRPNMRVFSDPAPGTYILTEEDPSGLGYALTDLVCVDSDTAGTASTFDLNTRTATINLDAGETVECTFTNTLQPLLTAIKYGYKWHDLNADGIWQQPDEPGLEGWTIWVDYDGDGDVDADEPSDVTDAVGYYEIININTGTWKVKEKAPVGETGWFCSFPAAGAPNDCYHQEDFEGGVTYGPNNFGNYQYATKAGYKWEDRFEPYGEWDHANEPALPGWPIELWDVTGTPSFVATATTNGNGYYEFSMLDPGRAYAVCELLSFNYVQTFPNASTPDPAGEQIFDCTVLGSLYGPYGYQFTASSGDTYLENNFGNREQPQTGTITTHKFNDWDGNGAQDAGEEDLDNWQMTLYEGSGCNSVNEMASSHTDNSGNVIFSNLEAGNYSVAETLQTGWQSTTDLCQDVTLPPGGSVVVEFGNQEEPPTTCIELVKEGPETAVPGETITYHFKVHNCGDVLLGGGAQVFDPLFDDDDYIWGGDLKPGESHEFEKKYTLPDDACGDFTNEAWAIGYPPGYPKVRDDASWTVDVSCDDPEPEPQSCTDPGAVSAEFSADYTKAWITNHSTLHTWTVGMASYKKYDNIIDNQSLFDYIDGVEVAPGETKELAVQLPGCAVQVDVFCGDVLLDLNGHRYGERLIRARHLRGNDFCGEPETGTIIIEKQTDPDGAIQSFEFSTDFGPNFTLADGEAYNSGPLTPDTYSVSENVPAGWALTSAKCDDGSDPSTIDLDAGETVTCTFTNTEQQLPPTCPSIAAKSENVEVLDYIPTDVRVQAFESDDYVRVWKEFEGSLATDLAYDLEEGRIAKTDGPSSSLMVIPADTEVCVYYIHLDNVGSSSRVQKTGFLEFTNDISGLIISGGNLGTFANKNLMFAAENQIGNTGTTYPDDSTIYPPNLDYLRGFDVNSGSNLDDAWFNGARLDFTMWVGNAHDSFRVILPLVP